MSGMGQQILTGVGQAKVVTIDNQGFSVDHWVERCLDTIIHIGKNSHPAIIAQAEAFKDDIRKALAYYMTQAIRSDRTTLYNEFSKQGSPEMAEILRRLK